MLPRVSRGDPAGRTVILAVPVLATMLAASLAGVMFAGLGSDPWDGLRTLLVDPLTGPDRLPGLMPTAAPLILCGLGVAMGCRADVWNLGAAGQFLAGGAACAGVATLAGPVGGVWEMPAMLLAGVTGGMAWAAIPAALRTRWATPEGLVSLLLSLAAVRLLDGSDGLPAPDVAAPKPLGFPMALTACGLAWWLLARTLTGFRLRVVGLAPQAAAYAGFSTNAVVWLCLLGSGGLAGLAGSLAVLGPAPPAMGHGIGYAAIVVALLGRLHPVGVVAAGLLVADLSMGGTHIAIGRGLTLADTGVMPGLLLVCLLGCDALARSGRVAKGR